MPFWLPVNDITVSSFTYLRTLHALIMTQVKRRLVFKFATRYQDSAMDQNWPRGRLVEYENGIKHKFFLIIFFLLVYFFYRSLIWFLMEGIIKMSIFTGKFMVLIFSLKVSFLSKTH